MDRVRHRRGTRSAFEVSVLERWATGVVFFVVCAVVLFGVYALVARFVLSGPVTSGSLAVSVGRVSGSPGELLGGAGDCRRSIRAGEWRCEVSDAGGSGAVTYRVRERRGSSCWDGLLVEDSAEGGMPRKISGCVRRWQWSLLASL
jgi:hypothetical protein